MADVPRPLCDGRALSRRTHLQLHVAGVRHRVGKEGGVGRREVIVAVVAHECFDARLFCHQRRGTESLAAPQQAVLAGARQERIGCGVETFVSNGVEKKEVAGRDVIVDLRFFRISPRHHTIIHLASKITMVAQHTGSHFGARLRRHVRDEDRGFAKRVEEPFAQQTVGVYKMIVGPKSKFPRGGVFCGAEQGAVGGIGQHGVDFRFGARLVRPLVLLLCDETRTLRRRERVPVSSPQLFERRHGLPSAFHGAFHRIDRIGDRRDHACAVAGRGSAAMRKRLVECIIHSSDARVELFAGRHLVRERTTRTKPGKEEGKQ